MVGHSAWWGEGREAFYSQKRGNWVKVMATPDRLAEPPLFSGVSCMWGIPLGSICRLIS